MISPILFGGHSELLRQIKKEKKKKKSKTTEKNMFDFINEQVEVIGKK